MKMHNPPHPGEVLKELCLKPMALTVTEAAKALGVSRKTLSAILNGRAGVSPEMAVRLSIAFDTTAESWLNQQVQYDLWQVERNRKKLRVKPLAHRFRPEPPNDRRISGPGADRTVDRRRDVDPKSDRNGDQASAPGSAACAGSAARGCSTQPV